MSSVEKMNIQFPTPGGQKQQSLKDSFEIESLLTIEFKNVYQKMFLNTTESFLSQFRCTYMTIPTKKHVTRVTQTKKNRRHILTELFENEFSFIYLSN